ncbi:MAG: diacylglycerol kinase [Candidatus Omnitrophica bacterium]|nr:diacylglycerol kinase [Candidatus Omnitrophota bacterium]
MKKQNIIQSFNSAIEGFIYVVKTQRNMRLHFLLAILALVLAIYLNLEKLEILLLLVTICLVLFAEMLNTAIEINTDLISDSFNPLVRIVKDISAGCVLVASLNALIVGYLLFFSRPWGPFVEGGISKIKSSPWHITLIILILVLFLVILGKVIFHKGTPLRGGMPSGHAAVAFAIWVTISFLTTSHIAMVLVLVLALLVARSRLSGGIHSIWEVAVGCALGILVPTLIFQIFR